MPACLTGLSNPWPVHASYGSIALESRVHVIFLSSSQSRIPIAGMTLDGSDIPSHIPFFCFILRIYR
jgi:hypothetical protein